MDVIYDTGSDWLAVEGSTCTTCEGNKFMEKESSSSKKIGTVLSTRNYGSAILTGYTYQDRVCISS